MATKRHRLKKCNEIIKIISSHGRRFFYFKEKNRTAHFLIDIHGKLRFVDEYNGRAILIVKAGRWRGFNNGGTLRRIVEDMARYIRTGEPVTNAHLGPWPDWICDGDIWRKMA